MDKLTPKQRRFAEEYIVDLNASAAYKRAGYKAQGNAAEANASRLLRNAKVASVISELKRERSERTQITADRVLEELAKLGFSNMLDYIEIGTNGDAYVDLSRMTRDQAAAVQEVAVEDFMDGRGEDAREVRRTKFKLADKKSALELLGKHLKLFTEKVEHAGAGGGPIQIVEVSGGGDDESEAESEAGRAGDVSWP
jgi:phage terminase small subunit